MESRDALTLMSEGLAFVQSENYSLAEEAYALALENAQATMGEAHPMTASLLGHLARACLAQNGKVEFAASLLERQLYMYENEPVLHSCTSEKLTAVQELAGVYELLGRQVEAANLSGKASRLLNDLTQNMQELSEDLDSVKCDAEDK